MKTRRLVMIVATALVTAALMGCGPRPSSQAEASAPAAPPSAPLAAPAPACSVTAAPAPRAASLGGDEALSVTRLVLARGVKDREPVNAATTFKSDAGKIYAFVEIENKQRAHDEIVIAFEPPAGGAPHGDVKLAVGASPRWRTWAYTRTARVAGSWTALVKNNKGDVLARAPFEVVL